MGSFGAILGGAEILRRQKKQNLDNTGEPNEHRRNARPESKPLVPPHPYSMESSLYGQPKQEKITSAILEQGHALWSEYESLEASLPAIRDRLDIDAEIKALQKMQKIKSAVAENETLGYVYDHFRAVAEIEKIRKKQQKLAEELSTIETATDTVSVTRTAEIRAELKKLDQQKTYWHPNDRLKLLLNAE